MRVETPDGNWVELREHVLFGDVRFANKQGSDELTQTAALLSRLITSWSYDFPVDIDGIDLLPLEAVTVLGTEIQRISEPLTKEATRPLGNGSSSSSSPSTATEKEQGMLVPAS